MGVINILILEINSKRLSNLVKVTKQLTGPEFEPSPPCLQSPSVFFTHLQPLGWLEPGLRHLSSSVELACHGGSKTMGRMSNVLVS